jgi:magnesium chelatase subunit I
VSVRLTVANTEVLVANATRRALRHGETEVVPRITDLEALAASTSGKIEIETLEEGRDGQIIENLLRGAILTTFRETFDLSELGGVLDAFEDARAVDAGEDISSATYAELAAELPALREAVNRLTEDESPAAVASAVEFVLEGLHLSKRLNKEAAGARATYRSRG